MSKNTITIDVGGHRPAEYLHHLHHAMTGALKLAFTLRALDLDEGDTHNLYVMLDFIQRIVKS